MPPPPSQHTPRSLSDIELSCQDRISAAISASTLFSMGLEFLAGSGNVDGRRRRGLERAGGLEGGGCRGREMRPPLIAARWKRRTTDKRPSEHNSHRPRTGQPCRAAVTDAARRRSHGGESPPARQRPPCAGSYPQQTFVDRSVSMRVRPHGGDSETTTQRGPATKRRTPVGNGSLKRQ